MLQKIFDKIEGKRNSKNHLWRLLISFKDYGWMINNMIGRNNPKKIDVLNFATTYVCNSKCQNCNIWEKYIKNPEKIKEELTLGEIKNIFNESKYLKYLKVISLGGGKITLRKDFVDLCGFFINKDRKSVV